MTLLLLYCTSPALYSLFHSLLSSLCLPFLLPVRSLLSLGAVANSQVISIQLPVLGALLNFHTLSSLPFLLPLPHFTLLSLTTVAKQAGGKHPAASTYAAPLASFTAVAFIPPTPTPPLPFPPPPPPLSHRGSKQAGGKHRAASTCAAPPPSPTALPHPSFPLLPFHFLCTVANGQVIGIQLPVLMPHPRPRTYASSPSSPSSFSFSSSPSSVSSRTCYSIALLHPLFLPLPSLPLPPLPPPPPLSPLSHHGSKQAGGKHPAASTYAAPLASFTAVAFIPPTPTPPLPPPLPLPLSHHGSKQAGDRRLATSTYAAPPPTCPLQAPAHRERDELSGQPHVLLQLQGDNVAAPATLPHSFTLFSSPFLLSLSLPFLDSLLPLLCLITVANRQVISIQLPVLMPHPRPRVPIQAPAHRQRDELSGQPHVLLQLQGDYVAVDGVEEGVVATHAVEEGVEPAGLEEVRQVGVEFSKVVVVFSIERVEAAGLEEAREVGVEFSQIVMVRAARGERRGQPRAKPQQMGPEGRLNGPAGGAAG
ncbi:unnamed protein product [Closterium sp. NIES-54]